MTQQLSLDGVSAQHIFDQNFEELKLHWVTGEEGADRCFDVEVVKLASSSSDLVGHLNLIHPSRLQICGEAEITYLNRLQKAQLRHQLIDLMSMNPPCFIIADGQEPNDELKL
jgi:HPr kinase/phosphorylase